MGSGKEEKGGDSMKKTDKKRSYRIAGVVAVILIASIATAFVLSGTSGKPKLSKVLGGEKRATLSPNYFLGKTSKAYRAAKEIPQILDKTYCYCKCQENFGHKSLLTCFVDNHGSKCGVCIDEAVMSYDLHKKGENTDSIVEKVDRFFSSRSNRG